MVFSVVFSGIVRGEKDAGSTDAVQGGASAEPKGGLRCQGRWA